MPKQFSNFEIVYNRCREAFNTELADFRNEKIDKEELDQLRKNLPTKIQTKAK
jgi:molybdopterin converting factor small subunit